MIRLSEIPGKLQRLVWRQLSRLAAPGVGLVQRWWLTPLNSKRNSRKAVRRLEIGPGPRRIEGFETLNVVPGPQVDYVLDASRGLPFENGTFDLIYASHVIEHIPWYKLQPVLDEWVRVLKRGGHLEVWAPDGLKIAKGFVDAELNDNNYIECDGWYRFNPDKDPCVWVNGRVFSYGDGDGNKSSPNWHMSMFSPRYLELLLRRSGLTAIEDLDLTQVRGHNHGWINLGMRGRKP